MKAFLEKLKVFLYDLAITDALRDPVSAFMLFLGVSAMICFLLALYL